jgi:hypothetical protein
MHKTKVFGNSLAEAARAASPPAISGSADAWRQIGDPSARL